MNVFVLDIPLLHLVPAMGVWPRQEGEAVGDGEGDAVPEDAPTVILALRVRGIHPL